MVARLLLFFLGFMILGWSYPESAFAYIPHWDPKEGFFVRQFSYLFFLFAMLFFFYELKQENLRQKPGFRFLALASGLFRVMEPGLLCGAIRRPESRRTCAHRAGRDFFPETRDDRSRRLGLLSDQIGSPAVGAGLLIPLFRHPGPGQKPNLSATMVSLPLFPVWLIDIVGSALIILIGWASFSLARKSKIQDPDNALWLFLFCLTGALLAFSLSRALGHILGHILVFSGYESLWKQIRPYSGGLNAIISIVVASITLFFHNSSEIIPPHDRRPSPHG